MKTRRYFSLIELLIVIGIMGALAALILPAFSDVERDAKDTACDYNQAGTIRYLKMFQSANGYYPTGFHTGGTDASWTNYSAKTKAEQEAAEYVELTTCGTHNFVKASEDFEIGGASVEPEDPKQPTDEEIKKNKAAGMGQSLVNAGIVTLAYGQGGKAGTKALSSGEKITIKTVKTCAQPSDTTWTEQIDPLTGKVPAAADEPLTFHGVSLGYIAKLGEADEAPAENATMDLAFRGREESAFSIVPLYVAPTVDWQHYYSDGGPEESKISIAMAGKCPWGTDGQARYYIAFFKVYHDGTPAKLLCTSCPDCGILEANAF